MENAEFDIDIIEKIHDLFISQRLRLAVAESCTGGLVSHMLTSKPGASEFYDSSIIPYSLESKKKLLGVSSSSIEDHGTVSEEVAREMAENVERKTGADVALAITGNLGPDPIENKKTGMVYIAVSSGKETTSRGFLFEGSRAEINQSASEEALHFLYEAVSAWT